MNKNEFISLVAQKADVTKKQAAEVVSAAFEAITEVLKNDDKLQITGFGTFEVKNRAERIGKNPRTKEDMVIPASKAPSFKASKTLKELLNN
ncbi:MAG: HU family DNA-binding protein [Clostridia bacterium]|nr:HU family DNA-binding protein [Clostridia bacterium]